MFMSMVFGLLLALPYFACWVWWLLGLRLISMITYWKPVFGLLQWILYKLCICSISFRQTWTMAFFQTKSMILSLAIVTDAWSNMLQIAFFAAIYSFRFLASKKILSVDQKHWVTFDRIIEWQEECDGSRIYQSVNRRGNRPWDGTAATEIVFQKMQAQK